MKFIITLLVSILAFFVMVYYGTSSLTIWIVLVVLWSLIDYVTYTKPFSWKDYAILIIVLTLIEVSSWYHYFGIL